MRTFSLACLAFALSGCAGVSQFLPHVNRYYRVYCISQSQLDELKKAQPEKIAGKLTGDAVRDTKILAGNLIEVRAHDDGLLEILGGCTDPNK